MPTVATSERVPMPSSLLQVIIRGDNAVVWHGRQQRSRSASVIVGTALATVAQQKNGRREANGS